LCYAISMTITKVTSDKDNVYTQMLHLYFGALLISILFFIFTGQGQFSNFKDATFQFIFREWFTNPYYSWPYIIIMGVVASLSFYFVFSAYSIASPTVVSLFEYSLIIWAIIIGYLLFDDIPLVRKKRCYSIKVFFKIFQIAFVIMIFIQSYNFIIL